MRVASSTGASSQEPVFSRNPHSLWKTLVSPFAGTAFHDRQIFTGKGLLKGGPFSIVRTGDDKEPVRVRASLSKILRWTLFGP